MRTLAVGFCLAAFGFMIAQAATLVLFAALAAIACDFIAETFDS